ncbi:MAG: hypothetical protein K2K81_10220 [Muribaculaceae bacterium]|nr:hypothetical protein [Muribaculaceae bacterium]
MTQLTQEDRDTILNSLLNSLATNCRKIEQLTPVNSLVDANIFELGGGKQVSFGVLKEVIIKLATESAKDVIGKSVSLDGITIMTKADAENIVKKEFEKPINFN